MHERSVLNPVSSSSLSTQVLSAAVVSDDVAALAVAVAMLECEKHKFETLLSGKQVLLDSWHR